MTDWLKKADQRQDSLQEQMSVVMSYCVAAGCYDAQDWIQKNFFDKKEASVFDNPEYQREDENIGDSGDFDPAHILDNKPDFANDPGPASATPGAPGTSVAPGTGLANGLFD